MSDNCRSDSRDQVQQQQHDDASSQYTASADDRDTKAENGRPFFAVSKPRHTIAPLAIQPTALASSFDRFLPQDLQGLGSAQINQLHAFLTFLDTWWNQQQQATQPAAVSGQFDNERCVSFFVDTLGKTGLVEERRFSVAKMFLDYAHFLGKFHSIQDSSSYLYVLKTDAELLANFSDSGILVEELHRLSADESPPQQLHARSDVDAASIVAKKLLACLASGITVSEDRRRRIEEQHRSRRQATRANRVRILSSMDDSITPQQPEGGTKYYGFFLTTDVPHNGACFYISTALSMLHRVFRRHLNFPDYGIQAMQYTSHFHSVTLACSSILARWLRFYVYIIAASKIDPSNVFFDAGIVNAKSFAPITEFTALDEPAFKTKNNPVRRFEQIPSLNCVFRRIVYLMLRVFDREIVNGGAHSPVPIQEFEALLYPLGSSETDFARTLWHHQELGALAQRPRIGERMLPAPVAGEASIDLSLIFFSQDSDGLMASAPKERWKDNVRNIVGDARWGGQGEAEVLSWLFRRVLTPQLRGWRAEDFPVAPFDRLCLFTANPQPQQGQFFWAQPMNAIPQASEHDYYDQVSVLHLGVHYNSMQFNILEDRWPTNPQLSSMRHMNKNPTKTDIADWLYRSKFHAPVQDFEEPTTTYSFALGMKQPAAKRARIDYESQDFAPQEEVAAAVESQDFAAMSDEDEQQSQQQQQQPAQDAFMQPVFEGSFVELLSSETNPLLDALFAENIQIKTGDGVKNFRARVVLDSGDSLTVRILQESAPTASPLKLKSMPKQQILSRQPVHENVLITIRNLD